MTVEILAADMGLRDLSPLFCGFEACESGHSYGPAVREHYIIHYVQSGKGILQYAGRVYHLGAGECFLIRPKEVTFYKADDAEPWRYLWVAFCGEKVDSLLRMAGLEAETVFSGSGATGLFDRFFADMRGAGFAEGNVGLSLLSFLCALFAALSRKSPAAPPLTQKERYVEKTKNYIALMYANRLTVQGLAQYNGLDRRYLCRLFRADTGYTLQEYLLRFRMQKAGALLLGSGLAVGDVARSVGYADVFNFSKMFKKIYGASPSAYRLSRGRAETPPQTAEGRARKNDGG